MNVIKMKPYFLKQGSPDISCVVRTTWNKTENVHVSRCQPIVDQDQGRISIINIFP